MCLFAAITISPRAPIRVVRNVCSASVQMRTAPSIADAPVESLTAGTAVQVINSLPNTAGYEWSLIQGGATGGYVPAASICL